MRKSEAVEVREQLLELLDERHEAGPTDYIVLRATVEPDGASTTDDDRDEWSLDLVFRPTADAALHGWRQRELRRISSGEAISAEAMAWDLYGTVLEGGLAVEGSTASSDAPPAGDDGIRWLTP